MADDKKEEGGKDMTHEIVYLLIGLFLLSIIINRIYAYFLYNQSNIFSVYWRIIKDFVVNNLWPLLKVLSVLVSFVAVASIIHVHRRFSALIREEQEIYGSLKIDSPVGAESLQKNKKWEGLIELINTPNPSDWRLAIIEADVMLEGALRTAGYHGDTLGEMLKSVDRSDLLTLDKAWDAHKVRNAIAHKGEEFRLNEREVKYTMSQFEEVFKELRII